MISDSYKLLFCDTSKDLLISFGSRGQTKVSPHNYLKNIPINQMHLFDRDGYSWFQNGVVGIAEDIFLLANYIKKTCQEYNFEKIICIGASMGGYAALVIGALINADKVIAISPQVELTHGWPLAPSDNVDLRISNARELIASAQQTQFLLISSSELLDVYHVSLLSDLSHVRHCILKSPHNILGIFKKSFLLDSFLENILHINKIEDVGIASLELNLCYIKTHLSKFLYNYFSQKYDLALPSIKTIVLLSPDWPDAQSMLAEILFNTKEYSNAFALYCTLNANDPSNVDYLNKLIFILSKDGTFNTKFSYFLDDLIFYSKSDYDRTEEEVFVRLASWATKMANHNLSIYTRNLLIDKYDHSNYSNYYRLGLAYQFLHKIEDSISCYKKVLGFKDQFKSSDVWMYERAISRLSSLGFAE